MTITTTPIKEELRGMFILKWWRKQALNAIRSAGHGGDAAVSYGPRGEVVIVVIGEDVAQALRDAFTPPPIQVALVVVIAIVADVLNNVEFEEESE